ncbi:hypothetical protein VNI00_013706 [Paramarasmius palmivorus]|uniref:Uncharacterized protein n=1 Tax=Paramarasmius palmivorus TaxID=297713 RepID=A0AAW0BXR2_9AGAR
MDGKHVELMKDELGRTEVPTRACYDEDAKAELRFGYDCVDQEKTVYDVRRYLDDTGLFQTHSEQKPLRNFYADPNYLFSAFLKHLQSRAETYFNQTINGAIIVVPADIADARREFLRNFETHAPRTYFRFGAQRPLRIYRSLAAPVASLHTHNLFEASDKEDINVLTVDIGATFEVSAILLEDGVAERLATIRSQEIGGDAFDQRLAQYLEVEYGKSSHGGLHEWMWHRKWNLTGEQKDLMKDTAEKAKVALFPYESFKDVLDEGVQVSFADFGPATDSGLELSTLVTKQIFYEVNKDLFWHIVDLAMQTLREAAVYRDIPGVLDVSQIVLTGGSSHLAPIREYLSMAFPNATILIDSRPDSLTIRGTAIHAAIAYGDPGPGPLLGCCDDITPMDIMFALGTKDALEVLIPKHYIIPTSGKRTLSLDGDTQIDEMRIYAGYSRTAGAPGSVLLGSIPIPSNMAEMEVKAEVDPEGKILVDIMGTETRSSYTFPIALDLWSDVEITAFIDKAVEHDRTRKGTIMDGL